MTATYSEALDAIYGMFKTAWDAQSVLTDAPVVYWPGVLNSVLPASDEYWARIRATDIVQKQSTLRNGLAPAERERYTAKGLVEIEIFCPMSVGDGLVQGRLLAEVARNAYRGKHSDNGVWFRDVTVTEVEPDRDWYRLHVSARYEYDEIG